MMLCAALPATAAAGAATSVRSSASHKHALTHARHRAAARKADLTAADEVIARSRARLHSFTSWLAAGHAQGYIGEVGWPGNPAAAGDPRWNAVARDWYAQARAAHLWVTAWAAGDFWQPSYKLLMYSTASFPSLLANPQAAIVEGQTAYPELRGVNVAGAEFGNTPVDEATSSFSNARSGREGTDYTFPKASSLQQLAQRGITLVRLPLRWERLQPSPGGALDPAYVAGIRATLQAAADAGLRVIVDLHNYGAYYLDQDGTGVRRAIGSPQLPDADFADVWSRLAQAIGDEPALVGYGLMNEPTGMAGAGAWQTASQDAFSAIRATGDTHRVFVAGYDWASVDGFARNHPGGPWIHGSNVVYEAHQYFDDDNTGQYSRSYGQELLRARAEGYRAGPALRRARAARARAIRAARSRRR